MKKLITLVNDGIYPIKFDYNGLPIEKKLDTGLSNPGTIQGEGKLIGTTCLYIRTSICNLRCAWRTPTGDGDICDTPFSSWKPEINKVKVEDVVKTIINNSFEKIKYVVITGGEPLVQPKSVSELSKKLREEGFHVTIETNGTLYDEEVFENVDLISLAPKLKNSIPWKENLRNTDYNYYESWALKHAKTRYKLVTLQKIIDTCYEKEDHLGFPKINHKKRRKDIDIQLKFVVSDILDIQEIKDDYLSKLKGIYPDDVILMSLGSNKEILNELYLFAMEESIKNGWRYTPRLQIDLFDNRRNV